MTDRADLLSISFFYWRRIPNEINVASAELGRKFFSTNRKTRNASLATVAMCCRRH